MILKNNPFGYKTSKELFEKVIKPRFSKLLISNSYDDYYDFIFSIGVLKDWLKSEDKGRFGNEGIWFWSEKYLSIFQTIYNNAKHYELKSRNYPYKYFIVDDNKSLFNTNKNGETVWDDSMLWDDAAIWVNGIIHGEPGSSNFYCIVQDNAGNQEKYFVYHICKEVYNFYENLFSAYMSSP